MQKPITDEFGHKNWSRHSSKHVLESNCKSKIQPETIELGETKFFELYGHSEITYMSIMLQETNECIRPDNFIPMLSFDTNMNVDPEDEKLENTLTEIVKQDGSVAIGQEIFKRFLDNFFLIMKLNDETNVEPKNEKTIVIFVNHNGTISIDQESFEKILEFHPTANQLMCMNVHIECDILRLHNFYRRKSIIELEPLQQCQLQLQWQRQQQQQQQPQLQQQKKKWIRLSLIILFFACIIIIGVIIFKNLSYNIYTTSYSPRLININTTNIYQT